MPILKLVGGISANITKQQAEAIASARWGRNGGQPTSNPTDPIELSEVGTFQVKDVRAILNENTFDSNKYEEAFKRNNEIIEKCKNYQARVKKLLPIQKAERMLKTYCYLCYRSKGNEGEAKDVMFEDPLYSKLMKPLVKYFEENPNEINAPRELYEKLIEGEILKIGAWNNN